MSIDYEALLAQAHANGASKLHLFPGRQPTYRVGRVLQPPLSDEVLTPADTSEVADELLTDAMREALDRGEDVERPFLAGQASGLVTIFRGLGEYHLVFHLEG